MSQSQSQSRRNAAATPATPVPAVPADPMALLDAIDAADWAGPPVASSGASSGTSQRQPIAWPADLVAIAQSAGVTLPVMPPRRIAGSPVAWIAAYSPSSDLSCLSEPIPTGTGKTGAKGTDQILYDACHGRFATPAGTITLPSMASGEKLPLAFLLKIAGKIKGKRANYFNRLIAGDKKGETACLLSAIAKKSGRFAYIEKASDGGYVVGLHSEPFASV